MPILLNELNAVGIPDKDMLIFFALGDHRPLDEPEMASLVGADTARRVRMFNPSAPITPMNS
jgi:nickel-dependent lactate racemase